MFVRYLLWNFAGRESDLQNAGWFTPWDALKEVPAIIDQNKARNNYLMLPLLLGIAGMFFQFRKNIKRLRLRDNAFLYDGPGAGALYQ